MFLFVSYFSFAQEKGISPVIKVPLKDAGIARAVIVGISDYQNQKITDLAYADKDAKAFATYLTSKDGGNLDTNNITLLLNDKATAGQFVGALYQLMEDSKEGDQAIIYFSGHGDVENTTINQPGFLLLWDAPSRVYMGGGTFGLSYLQEIISTISLKSKSRVLVITDACRAGKLAGSSIGGAQATAANLAKQYANEVKIMSCQPDEFSLEGKSWGGGRGVFSYYLLAGLQGLADRNSDGLVNLSEIERYLDDKVPIAAAPHSQIPMTVGNKNTTISKVNLEILAKLKKLELESGLLEVEQKSLALSNEEIKDSQLLKKINAFNLAMKNGHLLHPDENSAWNIFQELSKEKVLSKYIGLMKRNLAAALQDESQQAINDYLASDPMELKNRWNFSPKYEKNPEYLLKTAELLGENHFYYKAILSRAYYFKGLSLRLSAEKYKSDSLLILAMAEQEKGLVIEPNAPHILNEMGWILFLQNKFEKAFEKFDAARNFAPNWPLVWSNICSNYNAAGDYENGLITGEKAIELDSLQPQSYDNLGVSYFWKKDYPNSITFLKKAIALDSTFINSYYNLSENYKSLNNLDSSIYFRKKGLSFDSLNVLETNSLGYLYLLIGDTASAKKVYTKAKYILPTTAFSYQGMIEFYTYTHDFKNAKIELHNYIKQYKNDNFAYYLLATIAIQEHDNKSCIDFLKKAFSLGFNDFALILKDSKFKEIINTNEFIELKKSYFPN